MSGLSKKPSKTPSTMSAASSGRPRSTKPSTKPTSRPATRPPTKPGAKTTAKPSTSNSSVTGEKPKKGLEWTTPAYSICPKSKKGLDWEEIKKKTMRRHAPHGEDIKQIREVLKELKNAKIPVHEFMTLVSPYTADNGAELRSIFAEDMLDFQKMARRVYDTMTQDVSDVLMNEQVATVNFYQERHDLMTEKMMRSINEIYSMIPDFDFEKYYNLKDAYVESLLPLPQKVEVDEDTEELRKKQETYHRLQWIKNEGERMSEENRRLQARLNQLKQQQEIEQVAAQEAQAAVEAKRIQLEKEENKVRDQLHQMNDDVERSIIESEDQDVKNKNESSLANAISKRSKSAQATKKKQSLQKRRPEWVTATAQEMESAAAKESVATETATVPPPPNIRKMRKDDLEHSYHQAASTSEESPQDTVTERTRVVSQKRRVGPTGRQTLAPRDTWGGFR